jgi:hypothetical protein
MWYEVTSGPLAGRRVNLSLVGALLVVEASECDFYVHASVNATATSFAQLDGPYASEELAEAALDAMIAPEVIP